MCTAGPAAAIAPDENPSYHHLTEALKKQISQCEDYVQHYHKIGGMALVDCGSFQFIQLTRHHQCGEVRDVAEKVHQGHRHCQHGACDTRSAQRHEPRGQCQD